MRAEEARKLVQARKKYENTLDFIIGKIKYEAERGGDFIYLDMKVASDNQVNLEELGYELVPTDAPGLCAVHW